MNRKPCVLIVDNDDKYRNTVRQALETEYRVLEAGDVQTAVTLLTEQNDAISIAVLNMLLPEKAGFKVLSMINKHRKLWKISVLAVGSCDSELEKEALQCGADDYTGKSGDLFCLQIRMKRLLEIKAFYERERQLQDEAFYDYLTGILNRRGFDEAFDELWKDDLPVALYFFDLDNMKGVNDRFGHEAGDNMLRKFSEVLRLHTRKTDILARYGGDEFVMILKNISSDQIALKKGKEICDSFHSVQIEDGIFAGCSAGVAMGGINEKPSMELLKKADQALYRAKSENRGGCCL